MVFKKTLLNHHKLVHWWLVLIYDRKFLEVPTFRPMIKKYLKRLIIVNKEAILMEVLSVKGLMQLLMKTRNTGEKWTWEEKKEMKRYLRNIAKIIPAGAIFSLPGGSLLLPILAEALDRRKTRRLLQKKDQGNTFDKNL